MQLWEALCPDCASQAGRELRLPYLPPRVPTHLPVHLESHLKWTQPKAPFHQPRSQLPPHTSLRSPANTLTNRQAHTLTNGQHLLASPCLSQHLPSQTRPPGHSRAGWCGEKAPCWKGREDGDSRSPHPCSHQLASSADGQNTAVSKTRSPLRLSEEHSVPSLNCVQMGWPPPGLEDMKRGEAAGPGAASHWGRSKCESLGRPVQRSVVCYLTGSVSNGPKYLLMPPTAKHQEAPYLETQGSNPSAEDNPAGRRPGLGRGDLWDTACDNGGKDN